MNVLSDDVWATLVPRLKSKCPRLTDLDLRETQQRIDLVTAKIQSRHWISRVDAKRIVLNELQSLGVLAI
jgi:hypothetical protein